MRSSDVLDLPIRSGGLSDVKTDSNFLPPIKVTRVYYGYTCLHSSHRKVEPNNLFSGFKNMNFLGFLFLSFGTIYVKYMCFTEHVSMTKGPNGYYFVQMCILCSYKAKSPFRHNYQFKISYFCHLIGGITLY